ncbi:hypothetical protein BGW80DRAFT_879840 [Lactifluus volemus]|nr:hypothetical protein BGW80DRAFT_879840 [Lactifluus volemus]
MVGTYPDSQARSTKLQNRRSGAYWPGYLFNHLSDCYSMATLVTAMSSTTPQPDGHQRKSAVSRSNARCSPWRSAA